MAGVPEKTSGLVGLLKLGTDKAESDVKKLEDQLQLGQIEEVILQAENELSLAIKMLPWKPGEPLEEEPPANQWKWPI
uniref:NADH dehydrogenase [ubiquinone] 1 alpha subcomplex subunit 5 n=1 Tax=Sciurus vulgaris TaxID=55149 RepID=A0A8D2CWE2_SCIVU